MSKHFATLKRKLSEVDAFVSAETFMDLDVPLNKKMQLITSSSSNPYESLNPEKKLDLQTLVQLRIHRPVGPSYCEEEQEESNLDDLVFQCEKIQEVCDVLSCFNVCRDVSLLICEYL